MNQDYGVFLTLPEGTKIRIRNISPNNWEVHNYSSGKTTKCGDSGVKALKNCIRIAEAAAKDLMDARIKCAPQGELR